MNNNLQTQYSIELSVKGADKTNSAIRGIENTLNDITKTASNLDFKDTLKGVSDIESTLKSLREGEEDATKEMEALGRASEKAFRDLEKQAVKLNFSLSEQGKQQRQRIKELQEERAKLGESADAKKRAKEIDKEINSLLKNVVSASDEELSVMVAQNREARIRLKLVQQESRAYKAQQSIWKGLSRIVKDDNKSWKEKVKAVASYVRGLKLSEDQWKRIYSAAQKVGSIAKIGAGAIGIGLGAATIAGGAIVGSAVSYAHTQKEKEQEARRIKGGSASENLELLDALYTATGRDSASIVDAVNRVRSVLGNVPSSRIMPAVQAELEFPGTAALLRQQTSGSLSVQDFDLARYKQRQIQSVTGLSSDQMEGAHNYIRNMRQSRFGGSSMMDAESIYAALKGSGAYDNDDELNRAFDRFLRSQSTSGKNIFDYAKSYDFGRSIIGGQNKQQARQALSNIDFNALQNAAHSTGSVEKSGADELLEATRRFEVAKGKLLMNLIKILEPFAESLNKALTSETIDNIVKGLTDFLTKVVPKLADVFEKIMTLLGDLVSNVQSGGAFYGLTKLADQVFGIEKDNFFSADSTKARRDWLVNGVKGLFGYASGGITSMPSICGEAGPEAVIPLSYERSGRGAQILQQVEQHFNMSGSETTAASLASMVGSNAFLYETGRIGRLNRRRGI